MKLGLFLETTATSISDALKSAERTVDRHVMAIWKKEIINRLSKNTNHSNLDRNMYKSLSLKVQKT